MQPAWIRAICAATCGAAVVSTCALASAQTPSSHATTDGTALERSPAAVPAPGPYIHTLALAGIGMSLRFNNPYRLSNQLGDSGESLSRTPPYSSLGGAVLFGAPNGLQHGAALQWSRQLSGLPQHVMTPSYMLLYGPWRPWLLWGRAGIPIVVNPDANAGMEIAAGGVFLITAGIGVHAELIGDVFYGAATWDKGASTIPMLSFQAGIAVDYEVLP